MRDDKSQQIGGGNFSVLLHPSVVPVLDLFRSKRELEFTHDLTVMEEAEFDLTEWTSVAFAKTVLSEAVLLAFSLSREREQPMEYLLPGSRLVSVDERRLLALVSAFWVADPASASVRTAAALGIPADGLSTSAAANLARQIGRAGLPWPSYALLRDLEVSPVDQTVIAVSCTDDSAFKFKS